MHLSATAKSNCEKKQNKTKQNITKEKRKKKTPKQWVLNQFFDSDS